MARFDRKVERNKTGYKFSTKAEVVETKGAIFRKNFTFKWVDLNIKTILVFVLDFLVVTLLIIPFMMQFISAELAFVLGHGLLTSLLIILSGYLLNKEKPQFMSFIARFLFITILLTVSSALSMWVTSWLN